MLEQYNYPRKKNCRHNAVRQNVMRLDTKIECDMAKDHNDRVMQALLGRAKTSLTLLV